MDSGFSLGLTCFIVRFLWRPQVCQVFSAMGGLILEAEGFSKTFPNVVNKYFFASLLHAANVIEFIKGNIVPDSSIDPRVFIDNSVYCGISDQFWLPYS